MDPDQECESCAEGGIHDVPAVGHCENPDYSGYRFCQECIDEYDGRYPSINMKPRPSEPITFIKRLTAQGNGLGIHVDRSVADALGVDYGDTVEVTIRRIE